MSMLSDWLPEMTLRAPAVVPPIRLLGEPFALRKLIPSEVFATRAVPVTLVPMKLP